jgi:hypothetical protein
MDQTQISEKLDQLKKSIDLLVMIELAKSSATRDQIRNVLGGFDNSVLTKLNKALKNNQK